MRVYRVAFSKPYRPFRFRISFGTDKFNIAGIAGQSIDVSDRTRCGANSLKEVVGCADFDWPHAGTGKGEMVPLPLEYIGEGFQIERAEPQVERMRIGQHKNGNGGAVGPGLHAPKKNGAQCGIGKASWQRNFGVYDDLGFGIWCVGGCQTA